MTTQISPKVLGIIDSFEVNSKLVSIATKNKLHTDKAGDLHDIVALVLSGFLEASAFIKRVEIILDIPHEQALAVAEEVNREIFMPIREEMQKTSTTKVEEVPNAQTSQTLKQTPITESPKPQTPPPPTPPLSRPAAKLALPPIHELKTIAAMSSPQVTVDKSYINTDTTVKPIPADMKQRINSDPYKEAI